MTDIVERLRDGTKCLYSDDDIRRVMMLHCNAAADEIERLRRALWDVQAKAMETRMDVSKDAVLHHVYEIAREALRHD